MTESYLFQTYQRWPFTLVDGDKWKLVDEQGRQYTDLTSGIGVMNLGYHPAKVQAAMEEQLQHLIHTSNLYESPLGEQVAKKINAKLDLPETYLAFYANSGTEANEAALKLARRYTGRHTIINFENAFHGRTYGSLAVTPKPAYQDGYDVDVSHIETYPYNKAEVFKHLDQSVAAVILEMVQGEGGVQPAQLSWVQELVAKAHESGILVIVDEVQTGIGRTGKLFAFQHFGIVPDIVTSAKALGNGVPIGAMFGRKILGSAFTYGSHGTTFGGNPLAMASANAVLDCMNSHFLDFVAENAQVVQNRLMTLKTLSVVKDVRGFGMMFGITLTEQIPVTELISHLHERHILALSAGHNTLRLLPPLITPLSVLLEAVDIIGEELKRYE